MDYQSMHFSLWFLGVTGVYVCIDGTCRSHLYCSNDCSLADSWEKNLCG